MAWNVKDASVSWVRYGLLTIATCVTLLYCSLLGFKSSPKSLRVRSPAVDLDTSTVQTSAKLEVTQAGGHGTVRVTVTVPVCVAIMMP